jgi:hypothetical protein
VGETAHVSRLQERLAQVKLARVLGPSEVDVPAEEREGVEGLGRRQDGECYTTAGRYVALGPALRGREGAVLVHGVVRGGPGGRWRIGHGWAITPSGAVYDGVLGGFFDRDEYYEWAEAKEERRYTAREARKMIVEHGNWGCWHETAGIVHEA